LIAKSLAVGNGPEGMPYFLLERGPLRKGQGQVKLLPFSPHVLFQVVPCPVENFQLRGMDPPLFQGGLMLLPLEIKTRQCLPIGGEKNLGEPYLFIGIKLHHTPFPSNFCLLYYTLTSLKTKEDLKNPPKILPDKIQSYQVGKRDLKYLSS
jgi:hypothetical protein